MSQEETNNNFNLEKKKHFDFFLPYYQNKNWIVAEDNINSDHKNNWDVRLEISAGKYKLIDEKVRKGEFDDCLVEILQDINIGNLGWFYGEKDWILYGSWEDIENIYPSSLYVISAKGLKEYINTLDGFIKTCISKKGWGNTWNIVLYWEELINKKIAKKLI